MKILERIIWLLFIAFLLARLILVDRRTEAYLNQIQAMEENIASLNEELNNSYLLVKMDSGNVAKQLEAADFIQLKIIKVE